jgi:hypothetical protein
VIGTTSLLGSCTSLIITTTTLVQQERNGIGAKLQDTIVLRVATGAHVHNHSVGARCRLVCCYYMTSAYGSLGTTIGSALGLGKARGGEVTVVRAARGVAEILHAFAAVTVIQIHGGVARLDGDKWFSPLASRTAISFAVPGKKFVFIYFFWFERRPNSHHEKEVVCEIDVSHGLVCSLHPSLVTT